jgi:hypothetical protein
MKQIIALTLICSLQFTINAYACTVCQSQQPKVLQGITHGLGPESAWDYIIILSSCLLVLVTLILSLKHLLKPKEKNLNHVKYMIIERNSYD